MASGVILYRGPSLLDGEPIVVVATGLDGSCKNGATGDMISTYILRSDVNPVEAHRKGKDRSICGNCPHLAGTCYVALWQAPSQVFASLIAGTYPPYNRRKHLPYFAQRPIRLGSYGDPTAAPLSVYLPILSVAPGRAGYTHQWRHCNPDWRFFVMASVDSLAERDEAKERGWRTFRVRTPDSLPATGEIECPKSERAGHRLQCAYCLACDGVLPSEKAVDISIEPHGGSSVMNAVRKRFSLPLAS